MDIKSKLLANVGNIVTILGFMGAFFVLDDRYNNAGLSQDIETAKNTIVSEMRSEVATTRSGLIVLLQQIADDMEFEINTLERAGEPVPRIQTQRFKSTQRLIQDLKNADKNKTVPSS